MKPRFMFATSLENSDATIKRGLENVSGQPKDLTADICFLDSDVARFVKGTTPSSMAGR